MNNNLVVKVTSQKTEIKPKCDLVILDDFCRGDNLPKCNSAFFENAVKSVTISHGMILRENSRY